MDKKFSETLNKGDFDKHVESVDRRFDAVTKEMINMRNNMDRGFTELRDDFRQLQTSVDAYAVKADKYFMEMVGVRLK